MIGKYVSKIFLELPESLNSPASTDFDSDGNFYITSPNLHNDFFIKEGLMEKASPPAIGKVDKENNLSIWYSFKEEDFEKNSGVVTPMGIMFGPDGHAYIADMQDWFGGVSRLLRIIVNNGEAIKMEVIATGFKFPNGLAFIGDNLFLTDTTLKVTDDGKQVSGVYKFNIHEFDSNNPIFISPYVDDLNKDSHLFLTFVSSGKYKFGTNGITVDDSGNLYTNVMEDGSIYKTILDNNGNEVETTLFAKGFVSTDGMKWDSRTKKIYVADLFDNSIQSVDMNGNLELITKNGDSDGSNGELCAPSELVIRGNEIIVLNFNATFDFPEMVNSKPTKPHTLSLIVIE